MKPQTLKRLAIIVWIPWIIGLLAILIGYIGAGAAPVIRRTSVQLADWPANQRPLRAVFISDLHVTGPENPPARLASIVARINALKPDMVLIGGDFIADRWVGGSTTNIDSTIVELRKIKVPLGVHAVLGNHDNEHNPQEIYQQLNAAGIRAYRNEAAKVGPFTLGGVDDHATNSSNTDGTVMAMDRIPGARLMITHSPDIMPHVPSNVGLVLAGHTHCGQVSLPFYGPIKTMSRYGRRYACGIIREEGKTLIVSAGIGNSILPLRILTPPDIWVINIGPRNQANGMNHRRDEKRSRERGNQMPTATLSKE